MKLIYNKKISSPHVNLALEEYCVRNLDLTNEEFLLIYINDPSVVIGRHQNPFEETNVHYLEEHGIPLYRRISGGGAVFHDNGNINFSYIRKFSHNSINNYREFTHPIISTLNFFGATATLDERNNILINGKKVSGNAQFSNMKVMFSHGTLLFDSDLKRLGNSLKTRDQKVISHSIKSVPSSVTNIRESLTSPVKIDEFIDKLTENILGKNQLSHELSPNDWSEILELSESKYSKPEWNYDSCPEFLIQRNESTPVGKLSLEMKIVKGIICEIRLLNDSQPITETENLIGLKFRKGVIKKNLEKSSSFDKQTIEELVNFIY